jgi:hypothetical protein
LLYRVRTRGRGKTKQGAENTYELLLEDQTRLGRYTSQEWTRRWARRSDKPAHIALSLSYSGDGKPQEERDRRLAILAEIAAEAGLKDLRVRLRLFTQELAHVVLVSDDPLKKLKEILHGKAKRGPPKGAAQREIEIAAAVEERMRGGMTAKAAYDDVCRDKTIARQWKPPHNDGIRKIHEKMRTTGDGKKVAAPIVRLAATCNELRRKSKVKP